MTWFEGLPEGDTDWDRLAARFPEAFDALAGIVAAAWQDTDPALLELARLEDRQAARKHAWSSDSAAPGRLRAGSASRRWPTWRRGRRRRSSHRSSGPAWR